MQLFSQNCSRTSEIIGAHATYFDDEPGTSLERVAFVLVRRCVDSVSFTAQGLTNSCLTIDVPPLFTTRGGKCAVQGGGAADQIYRVLLDVLDNFLQFLRL